MIWILTDVNIWQHIDRPGLQSIVENKLLSEKVVAVKDKPLRYAWVRCREWGGW